MGAAHPGRSIYCDDGAPTASSKEQAATERRVLKMYQKFILHPELVDWYVNRWKPKKNKQTNTKEREWGKQQRKPNTACASIFFLDSKSFFFFLLFFFFQFKCQTVYGWTGSSTWATA
jgi:hypothetical protein